MSIFFGFGIERVQTIIGLLLVINIYIFKIFITTISQGQICGKA